MRITKAARQAAMDEREAHDAAQRDFFVNWARSGMKLGLLQRQQERQRRRRDLIEKAGILSLGATVGLAVGVVAGTFAEDRLWFFRYLRAHGDVE